MKSSKFNILVTITLILLGISFFEYVLTSRINLNFRFFFPAALEENTTFDLTISNEDGSEEYKITPNSNEIKLGNKKHGSYNLNVFLDDMPLINESYDFHKEFSFLRETFEKSISITDISSITSVEYKIADPWLRIKWFSQNLGDYKPIQYKVSILGKPDYLNVNYFEIDIREFLSNGITNIPIEISPVTKNKKILSTFKDELPVELKKISLDVPPQFDSFEISVDIDDNHMQINPYDMSFEFPILSNRENIKYIDVLYQKEKVFSATITNNDKTLALPTIPYATVTDAVMENGTLTLNIALDNKDGFLQNFFSEFLVQYEDKEFSTDSIVELPATDNAMNIFIIPRFKLGIPGYASLYVKPSSPVINIESSSKFATGTVDLTIHSGTSALTTGRIRIDRKDWVDIPEFKELYPISFKMDYERVHLVEIELHDELGQSGMYSKWLDPNTPQLGFFKNIKIVDGILNSEWGNTDLYEKLILIVTDGYNRVTLYPDKNESTVNLRNSVLTYPLKLILKGVKDDVQYTYAIEENIIPD